MGKNNSRIIHSNFKYKAIVTSIKNVDDDIKVHYNKVGSYLIDNDIKCDFVSTKYHSKYLMMVSSIKHIEL